MNIPPRRLSSRIEPLEPRIAPSAVISLASVRIIGPTTAVPGQTVIVAVDLTNTGDQAFHGTRGVHLYLSTDQVLDGSDLPFEFPNQPASLGAQKSKTLIEKIELPELSLPTPDFPAGPLYVIGQLPQTGDTAASGAFTQVFQFGTVGGNKGIVLSGHDDDGTRFTFGLTGSGTGTIAPGPLGVDLSFIGTDAKSTAVAGTSKTTGDSFVTLRKISGGTLGHLVMPAVNATNNITFSGLNALVLHDVGTFDVQHNIELGSTDSVKIAMHRVADMNMHAAGTISSLTVAAWNDVDGSGDMIDATSIFQLKAVGDKIAGVPGDFAASLALHGGGGDIFYSLHSARIAGVLSHATWTLDSGGIKDVRAAQINSLIVKAEGIDSLWASGDAKTLLSGNIMDTQLTLHEASVPFDNKVNATGRIVSLYIDAPKSTINSITADDWQGGSLNAVQLGKLDLSGDAKAKVRGDLSSVPIVLTGTSGKTSMFDVAGSVTRSSIATSEPSAFVFDRMFQSDINASADIKSFEIKGDKAVTEDWFTASNVKAQSNTIGKVILRNVYADPLPQPFGITADVVKSYKRSVLGGFLPTQKNLDTPPGTYDQAGSFSLVIT